MLTTAETISQYYNYKAEDKAYSWLRKVYWSGRDILSHSENKQQLNMLCWRKKCPLILLIFPTLLVEYYKEQGEGVSLIKLCNNVMEQALK